MNIKHIIFLISLCIMLSLIAEREAVIVVSCKTHLKAGMTEVLMVLMHANIRVVCNKSPDMLIHLGLIQHK